MEVDAGFFHELDEVVGDVVAIYSRFGIDEAFDGVADAVEVDALEFEEVEVVEGGAGFVVEFFGDTGDELLVIDGDDDDTERGVDFIGATEFTCDGGDFLDGFGDTVEDHEVVVVATGVGMGCDIGAGFADEVVTSDEFVAAHEVCDVDAVGAAGVALLGEALLFFFEGFGAEAYSQFIDGVGCIFREEGLLRG